MKTNLLRIEFCFGVGSNAFGNLNTPQIRKQAKTEITRIAEELFGGYRWVHCTIHRNEKEAVLLTVGTSEQDTKKVRAAVTMLADVIRGALAVTEVSISVEKIQHYKY